MCIVPVGSEAKGCSRLQLVAARSNLGTGEELELCQMETFGV